MRSNGESRIVHYKCTSCHAHTTHSAHSIALSLSVCDWQPQFVAIGRRLLFCPSRKGFALARFVAVLMSKFLSPSGPLELLLLALTLRPFVSQSACCVLLLFCDPLFSLASLRLSSFLLLFQLGSAIYDTFVVSIS